MHFEVSLRLDRRRTGIPCNLDSFDVGARRTAPPFALVRKPSCPLPSPPPNAPQLMSHKLLSGGAPAVLNGRGIEVAIFCRGYAVLRPDIEIFQSLLERLPAFMRGFPKPGAVRIWTTRCLTSVFLRYPCFSCGADRAEAGQHKGGMRS